MAEREVTNWRLVKTRNCVYETSAYSIPFIKASNVFILKGHFWRVCVCVQDMWVLSRQLAFLWAWMRILNVHVHVRHCPRLFCWCSENCLPMQIRREHVHVVVTASSSAQICVGEFGSCWCHKPQMENEGDWLPENTALRFEAFHFPSLINFHIGLTLPNYTNSS